MSIILDGHSLNPNMIWVDRYQWSPVEQDVQYSLVGVPKISVALMAGTRPITLIAIKDQGWLIKASADYVQNLAQNPGGVYSLVIGDENFNVMFRHHEPNAVDLTGLIERGVPLDQDYFIGTIKLMAI